MRIRYRLKHLFWLMTVMAVVLGYWLQSTWRQKRVVEAIEAAGGSVSYRVSGEAFRAVELSRANPTHRPRQSWVPHLLLEKLGVDPFHPVTEVDFRFLPEKEVSQLPTFAQLTQLPQLSRLSVISFAPFPAQEIFDVIPKLPRLTRLDLYGPGTQEGLLPERPLSFANVPLVELTVEAIDLDDRRWRNFRDLNHLKALHLRGNLSDEVLPEIASFAQLVSLSLKGKFTSQGLAKLAPLTEIEQLSIINEGDQVDREFVATIAKQFPRLRWLRLWSIRSNEDLKPLAGHPALTTLELDHLMLYSLDEIRALLPNISVSAEFD